MNINNGANHKPSLAPDVTSGRVKPTSHPFDQPVIFQQSPLWSRAIVWGIIGVTTFVVVWAAVAKIEEAVPASGQLEPQGVVKAVQAPIEGVVTAIRVKDGDRVKKGDLLLSLDPAAAKAQLTSLQKVRTALSQENQFYQAQMGGSAPFAAEEIVRLKLPPELTSLTKSRAALIAENQLYRLQLSGSSQGANLAPEQQAFLQSSQAELNSRVAAAKLDVGQLSRQLIQAQVQLANAKETLAVNRRILGDIEPLALEGGISRIQYLKQKQEVNTSQAEADRLVQEQERLKLAIAQSQEKLQNTLSLSQKDVLTQMADNDKRIAEIDSQLTKAMVENSKQISEIDGQLSQTQLTLKRQELRAPVDGTVFDLQAHTPGFVARASEPILKIVPDDTLTAKVFITNQDIGFVKEGMPADVRIDSFPFSEFGDIKGELVWIGSDALPPDEVRRFYSFPAKVRLKQQFLRINGREVALQSGMSVTTNLKIRERTVMSIFTNLFSDKMDSFRTVR
jgi:multidrug efflux pump subunit AcrA (membrane-fusion protein)